MGDRVRQSISTRYAPKATIPPSSSNPTNSCLSTKGPHQSTISKMCYVMLADPTSMQRRPTTSTLLDIEVAPQIHHHGTILDVCWLVISHSYCSADSGTGKRIQIKFLASPTSNTTSSVASYPLLLLPQPPTLQAV
jgi:hypothetical protein